MRRNAPAALGIAVVVLVAAAAAVVAASEQHDADRDARGAAFQELIGGLGLGPATDLAHCEAAFDARLGGTCADGLDPLPGRVLPCGHGGADADR